MSFNQSRSDKNENAQYRKTTRSARSNQQRGFSGPYGKGSGASVGGPAPSPSISSNRSFKKSNNNAQGGQSRANVSSVHSSDPTNAALPRGAQNGAHTQPHLQVSKQVEPSSTQRSSRPVPNAPTSQSSSVSPDTAATNTPTKAPGDGTKAFPFQFESISPGFMNGMQIPAQTSSALPNLDEQKRDQARHDSYRSAPPVPTPSVPKQQLHWKDPGGVDQLNTAEAHPLPKAKKDVLVSPAPSSQSQEPSGLPITGISMPMPFHHPPEETTGNVVLTLETAQGGMDEPRSRCPEQERIGANLCRSTSAVVDSKQVEGSYGDKSLSRSDSISSNEIAFPKSGRLDDQSAPAQASGGLNATSKNDGGNVENVGGGGVSAENTDAAGVSVPQSGSKDKPLIELNRSKSTVSKGKKKRREILRKADTARTTSDLYMAYKGPEEKKEVLISSESTENISGNINLKRLAADEPQEDPVLSEKDAQGKVEPDGADISKPKLETSDNGEQVHGDVVHDDKYGMGNMAKKYSRDFLLKFADQFIDLPEGFEIKTEIDDQSAPAQASGGLNATSKNNGGNVENVGGGGVSAENTDAAGVSVPRSGSKDKPLIELNRSKSTVSKGKKKRREILRKADAARTTSDLYMSYEGPEEKKEVLISSESISGNINLKHLAANEPHEDPVLSEKDAQDKVEPDDWEDAADISKPKLETSDNGEQVHGDMVHDDKYGMGNMAKKYSRDFLLKFADQFIDLPEVFEIKTEIDDQSPPAQASGGLNATSKNNGGKLENVGGGGVSAENTDAAGVSVPRSGSKDKPLVELNRSKSTVSKGKKKRREILRKADAARTTSDLYILYEGPEEKKEVLISSESISGNINLKHLAADEPHEDPVLSEKDAQDKVEPDDWEDAADISKPKLETSDNGEQVHGDMVHDDKYGTGNMAKKYSRDFLLKFADQFVDLPEGFEIKSEIDDQSAPAQASGGLNATSKNDGGNVENVGGGGVSAENTDAAGVSVPQSGSKDKPLIELNRSKSTASKGKKKRREILWKADAARTTSDLYMSYKGPEEKKAVLISSDLRPGQLVNYGVLRNPRGPIQYPGVLGSPMQSVGSQGMQRNSPDANRWQRATNFHKGLIPSPQTPLQKMHKAEKKYEVGKVTEEEQAKQRQLKAIFKETNSTEL